MFHVLAYTVSHTGTSEFDITPLSDPVFPIQNSHFLPNQDVTLLWAAAIGTTLSKARITTPTLLQLTTPFIRPLIAGLIGVDKTRVARMYRNPITLRAFEEISVLVTHTAAGAEQNTILLAISQGVPGPVPGGGVYALRGTGTTTVVANAWTQCPITWQNSLPNGQYAVIGMEFISVNAQAGRLIFPAQVWRPGCYGMPTALSVPDQLFLEGHLGVWGTFNTTTVPQVEVLCNGADTAQEVYLYCVRTG